MSELDKAWAESHPEATSQPFHAFNRSTFARHALAKFERANSRLSAEIVEQLLKSDFVPHRQYEHRSEIAVIEMEDWIHSNGCTHATANAAGESF